MKYTGTKDTFKQAEDNLKKKSNILSDSLSFIPLLGGGISGSIEPPPGMSVRQGTDVLGGYGFTGGATTPIGFLFSSIKNIPTTKQQLKNILLKTIIASGVGTAAGTQIGRSLESRNVSTPKTGNDQSPTQSAPGFISQLAKEWITDPPKGAINDSAKSVDLATSGDFQGALGKGLSGVGNAILTASMFVPGLGLLGRGARLGSKGIGFVAKSIGANNAANKINRGGAIASKYLKAPSAILSKNVPFLSKMIGNQKILKTTKPSPGLNKTQNIKRLSGNLGKSIVNFGVPSASILTPLVGGELTYASSPSGQMDAMTNSSIFEDIVGKDMVNEISGLSSKDKLRIYEYLKGTDIPSRVLGDWSSK